MNIFSYKWWWSRIGGRPWTYILRDVWHKYEFIPIFVLMSAGGLIVYLWGLALLFIILAILFIGYIIGHLFWGKKYIEGQQG